MNKFMTFSANVQNAFDNDESKYLNFSQLLIDYTSNTFQSGITKADADEMIREKFRLIMGVDSNSSKKDIRRAFQKNKDELFQIIEDVVDNMLTSGWESNPFFMDFVDIRNLALGDANEFESVDETVLSVGKLSGDNWDIDRQRLGLGEVTRIPTYWVGLGVYEEFERVMLGRADWSRLVNAIYTAMDNYVNEVVFEAVRDAGSKFFPANSQFYKTAALDAAAHDTFIEMVEDVQAANKGSEVVIMGTKSALAKLKNMADVNWIAKEDRTDNRNLGYLGIFEGTRVVEIPQVFKKNDTTQKLVKNSLGQDFLLIMPLADNKFVKLVYEGDPIMKETTDNTVNQDMTYEVKYMTKLGVGTMMGRYFGTWNITQ